MPTNATSIGERATERSRAPALGGRVRRVAGQEEKRARVDPLHDPLAQVAPEARGVGVAHAHVLVEMEHVHPSPLDVRRRGERLEELELRGAGRGDDARFPVAQDRLADGRRGPLRRRTTQLLLRVEDPDVHVSRPPVRAGPRAPTRNASHCFAMSRWYGSVMWMPSRQTKVPRSGDAARRGLTSITVMPLSRATAFSLSRRPFGRALGVVHVVEGQHLRARLGEAPAEATEALEVLVGPVDDHEQDLLGLPREHVRVEPLERPRRGEPAALELAELHPGVLAGEDRGHHRHEGPGSGPVQLHREGVADDRDALRRQGPDPGTRAFTSGSSRSSLARTLSSRMPRFFSPQFQFFRAAICHSAALVPTGRGAALPLELAAHREEVLVRPRQAQLAEVDGQAEAGVEGEQLLQTIAVALDLEVRLEEAGDRPHAATRRSSCARASHRVKTLTGSESASTRPEARSGSRSALGSKVEGFPSAQARTAFTSAFSRAAWCVSSAASCASVSDPGE